MAVFNCPQCGLSPWVHDKHIGTTAKCPNCKTQGEVVWGPVDAHSAAIVDEHEWHVVRRLQTPREPVFARKVPSLTLEWVVIDDRRMPLHFKDVCGITPNFEGLRSTIDGTPSPNSAGRINWGYEATFAMKSVERAVVGLDVRFLLFSIWGDYTRTLYATQVAECEPGQELSLVYRWPFDSQREGDEHLASIAYLARVRTKDGQVLNADTAFVLREAQRFSVKFTEDNLEPRSQRGRDPS